MAYDTVFFINFLYNRYIFFLGFSALEGQPRNKHKLGVRVAPISLMIRTKLRVTFTQRF